MEELIYRDRRGSNSSKWNHLTGRFTREDLLGLWVADMDFAAPACVREALARQVEFGVFGYDIPRSPITRPSSSGRARTTTTRSSGSGCATPPAWWRRSTGLSSF